MKFADITPSWFFTEVSFPLRFFLIFIRGDAIVLVPFFIFLFVVGLFSREWVTLLIGLYFTFRFLGEMIYWLLQQFGNRKYRPYDFGFKRLDNNALYIIYQLYSLVGMVLGAALVIGAVLTWK